MSFPKYEAYKDSGVEWLGEVPEHWRVDPLKYHAQVFPSNVDKKTYEGQTQIRLCNYTDVYYNDEIIEGMDLMPATATEEQIEKFSLKAGDVIFTKDSETADDIAIAAYVPRDLPGVICGYHLSIVRSNTTVDGAFIKRFFDSRSAKAYFEVSANGLTRVGLSQYATDNVPTPIPPLSEQTQIARFLDHETARIDALIAEQQRLIELLKEKRQAVISHTVTKGLDPTAPMKDSGVEWLGEVPAHWEVAKVKHVIQSFEQGWSPQCDNVPVENDEEWGVLKVGCVNGGIFSPTENKRLPDNLDPIPELFLKTGDILISRANTRELVGNAALVDADQPNLMLSDKLFRLRTTGDMLPKYLVFYLGISTVRYQIELDATGASSSMLNIGQAIIKELPIPVPPVVEQQDIATQLETSLDNLYLLQKEAQLTQKLLQERRSALISAAVTGKIDVRGWQAPASAPPVPTLEPTNGRQ